MNLCSRSPCKNKGTCVQEKARPHCLCPPGWDGAYCDVLNVSCKAAALQKGELRGIWGQRVPKGQGSGERLEECLEIAKRKVVEMKLRQIPL